MNMSKVLSEIKLDLGLGVIHTVFEDIDNTIITIIQNTTIPVFSKYHAFQQDVCFDLSDLDVLYKNVNRRCYRLPYTEKSPMKLLYVYDVQYESSTMNGIGYYGSGLPFMGNINTIQQMMMANANSQIANLSIPKMTFKFEPPNKLWLYEMYASQKVWMKLGFEHLKNLSSLSDSGEDRSFFDLAELDVKMKLYPTMKQFTQINTAYGNIDLKIDDWADAKSERKELLDRWEDSYHLDLPPFYWA